MEKENEMESNASAVQVKGVPIHGGTFIQYNVLGNLFEIPSKYPPPITPVGRGAYGLVCSATDAEMKEEVAIKRIANTFDNRIDAKRTLREIKLLTHMDHENVIKIKDIIRPPDKADYNDVYIAYELMDTDLHQIIGSTQELTEDHCQVFCLDHRSYSRHQCPKAGKNDVTIVVCPLCAKGVRLIPEEDPNITWESHVNIDCDPSNYEQATKKRKCPVPRCKEMLSI